MIESLSNREAASLPATPTHPPGSNDLDPWVPQGNDRWDHRKAAHLLRRAGFGYAPEQIKPVIGLEMDAAVEQLLNTDRTQLPTSGTITLPHGETLNLANVAGQRGHWLYECINGASPLKEKMVLFWADHFSVGADNRTAAAQMVAHTNIFRRHGLGRFRDILIDVTRDPAMLLWLDNYLSGRNGEINENYSRELLELYSMGVNGGYTEFDVVEAAKCLSGWSLNARVTPVQFLYRGAWHITGPKTVFGQTIHNVQSPQREGVELIDLILQQTATAEYVASKIWAWFVSDRPEPALIAQLGAQWRASGYDIKALLRTILKSRYFYSDRSMRTMIKNPVEYITSLVKATGTMLGRYNSLGTWVEFMGWPLLRYTNPAGLDDGQAWINSQTAIMRANFANEMTSVGGSRTLRARFNPRRETATRPWLTDEKSVVDHYLENLVQSDAPPLVVWTLQAFLSHDDNGLILFRPNTATGDAKMRGFIHALATLPEFQIN